MHTHTHNIKLAVHTTHTTGTHTTYSLHGCHSQQECVNQCTVLTYHRYTHHVFVTWVSLTYNKIAWITLNHKVLCFFPLWLKHSTKNHIWKQHWNVVCNVVCCVSILALCACIGVVKEVLLDKKVMCVCVCVCVSVCVCVYSYICLCSCVCGVCMCVCVHMWC